MFDSDTLGFALNLTRDVDAALGARPKTVVSLVGPRLSGPNAWGRVCPGSRRFDDSILPCLCAPP
jgi:hypothetical protein